MTIATILLVIVVHIGACNAFDGITNLFIPFTYQQVEMVAHQTISIVYTICSAGHSVVVIPHTHTVESIYELPAILLILEDILVINAAHHHMKYPSSRIYPCPTWHTLL